jgi:hypothetical protein
MSDMFFESLTSSMALKAFENWQVMINALIVTMSETRVFQNETRPRREVGLLVRPRTRRDEKFNNFSLTLSLSLSLITTENGVKTLIL